LRLREQNRRQHRPGGKLVQSVGLPHPGENASLRIIRGRIGSDRPGRTETKSAKTAIPAVNAKHHATGTKRGHDTATQAPPDFGLADNKLAGEAAPVGLLPLAVGQVLLVHGFLFPFDRLGRRLMRRWRA